MGLPEKHGEPLPMFDYEKLIYDTIIEKPHRVWIKKATGLGITEFFLYFMLWLALVRPPNLETWLKNSRMVIVTGPREGIAKDIIERMKIKLEAIGIQDPFETRNTVINIDDIRIEAYPSFSPSWRGLPKVSFILVDEADFFRESEQDNVRDVVERYVPKSGAWIAMVSTPNKPRGLFDRMENEDSDYYSKLVLDYKWGEGKIYTPEDIQQAKLSPSFGREYECQYLGGIGDVFSQNVLDDIITDTEYDPDNPGYGPRSMGIDAAWGSSSNIGITITQKTGDKVQVLFSDDYAQQDFPVMMDEIWRLIKQYAPINKIYVDSANPEVVRRLKLAIGEDGNWLEQKKRFTHNKWDPQRLWKIIPIAFGSEEGRSLLPHAKMMVEQREIMIHKRFDKLTTALRTAQTQELTNKLDKRQTSFSDVLDSFMLSLYYYISKGEVVKK